MTSVSSKVVPDDVRAVLVGKVDSKHKGALPAQLECGRVYRAVDPAAGGAKGELRVVVQRDGEGYHLDYFTRADETTWHARVAMDGTVTPLENYEGQWGLNLTGDPAADAAERKRVADHNRTTAQVLREKGFE